MRWRSEPRRSSTLVEQLVDVQLLAVDARASTARRSPRRRAVDAVDLLDRAGDLVAAGDRGDDLVAGRGADRGDRGVVGRFGERDDELVALEVDGERLVLPRATSAGTSVGRVLVERRVLEVDEPDAEARRSPR